jgi:hypothetical protein
MLKRMTIRNLTVFSRAELEYARHLNVVAGKTVLARRTCQDFVSRAVTGHNGSPTRDAIVGVGLLCTAACVVAVALSKE